jgi:hypothetical protein
MLNALTESPIFKHPKVWWMPFVSLTMTLYGILVLQWNLQPIVFLFWFELFLVVVFSMIRMLFAMGEKTLLAALPMKLMLLMFGTLMGGAMLLLAVTFTFKAFVEGDYKGFSSINLQMRGLSAAYLMGLIIHYFANGAYKTANPYLELMKSFVYLLVFLAFLMAITMHLLPNFPQLNQARWVAISIVLLKFVFDWLFHKVNSKIKSEGF